MCVLQYRKSINDLTRKSCIAIYLLFFLLHTAYPQENRLIPEIPFANISIQNGLPQNTVIDIVRDLDGYIWFATQVGAARYDGYEFDYFNASNGLVNNL